MADRFRKCDQAAAPKQRLKEAVWRIQGLIYQGRLSRQRTRIIEAELALLATAVGVEPLQPWEPFPRA